MKSIKRLLSIAIIAAMLLGLLVGCGTQAEAPADPAEPAAPAAPAEPAAPADPATPEEPSIPVTPAKIAVAFNAMGTPELVMKAYLEEYIGPAFNTEFFFSEALTDAGAIVTFIEQAYAAGCNGIMNFNSDVIEQATSLANDFGMYIINQTNKVPDTIKDMPYNIGSIGSSVPVIAEAYGELVKAVVADGQPHNIVIVSGGAPMGNNQHRETTVAILDILQETYGLTYDADLQTLATVNTQTILETGTDMKIAIYPGYAGADTYVTGFSSLLQSGEYDVVLSTYGVYPQLMQPISEVETAFGFDVQLVSIANIDDGARTAFDSGALNSAIVTPGCMIVGNMFLLLYNAIEGNAEAMRVDGQAVQFETLKWVCSDAAEFLTIEQLDTRAETYAVTIDDVNAMRISLNPEIGFEALNEFFKSLTAKAVAEKSGF